MAELKRTRGPWSVNADPRYEGGKPCLIWGPEGPGHGAVCEMTAHYPREFNGADARLIAASPELFAALVELLPYAEKEIDRLSDAAVGGLYPNILTAKLNRARAAIANAGN